MGGFLEEVVLELKAIGGNEINWGTCRMKGRHSPFRGTSAYTNPMIGVYEGSLMILRK